MHCSYPRYQPSLFHLAVNLPKCDLFEQLFNLSLYCAVTNKEVIVTFYYVFNKELLCSYGQKIKYQLSANYKTSNFVFNTGIICQAFLFKVTVSV